MIEIDKALTDCLISDDLYTVVMAWEKIQQHKREFNHRIKYPLRNVWQRGFKDGMKQGILAEPKAVLFGDVLTAYNEGCVEAVVTRSEMWELWGLEV